MAAVSVELPPLSEAVELQFEAICREKKQPPPDAVARRHLSEIGEQESLKILKIIRNTVEIRNFSRFIVHLVNNKNSLQSNSPPLSLTKSPQGNTSCGRKRKSESDSPGDVSTGRRVCKLSSPMKIEEEPVVPKIKRDIVFEALETLEFRKTFLLLNYVGWDKLEDVSVDQILSYRSLGMREFEIDIWNKFGRPSDKKERVNKMNWETGERYNYHCHIDSRGNCRFKGPYLNKAATLLQKTVEDENVIIMKFMEEETESLGAVSMMQNPIFNEIAEKGFFVGRKRYRFFVHKDGGKEVKKKDSVSSSVKCYFVCTEGFARVLNKHPHQLSDMPIQEARALFMHIHTVSSPTIYNIRLSLILSKAITLDINYNDLRAEVLEDIYCLNKDGSIAKDNDGKVMILTDGTGFISEDLALRCPHNCTHGCVNSEDDDQGSLEAIQFPHNFSVLNEYKSPIVPPLLIQFRLFHQGRAIKGTVLVNKKLPPNTIQVRRSMLKVDRDDEIPIDAPAVNSFEVVATSNKPKVAGLSKTLIALLSYGGVPREYFLALLSEALKKQLAVFHKPKPALRVAVNWDFSGDFVPAKMVASGIPLDEPFLLDRLSDIAKEEMKSLKGGKFSVKGSCYVMGTVDPTGILNRGEVCVILEEGQLSGPVLVYRNPGTHTGDIHVVTARYIEGLKDVVGNAKYGIFFPCKGPRSMADEIAGGDYDGDMYWVSTNAEAIHPRLLFSSFQLLQHFRPSEPWICSTSSPIVKKVASLSSGETLERELFRLYLTTRFQPSKAMGIAADSWLVYMDRVLTLGDECADEKAALRRKMDELINIYYDALDAPKKGKKVVVPERLIPEKYPHYMGRGEHCIYKSKSVLGEIHDIVDQFTTPITIWKLKCFDVEILEMHRRLWTDHYSSYRTDMRRALNESGNTVAVYQHYRKVLYGGVDDLESSEKEWQEIRLEALAIYRVCYDYAIEKKEPKKCGFAWKVAGDALWKIHLQDTEEKSLLFAPSVVRQMMH